MTTGIGARLDAAVAAAKPKNRSSDLVPLTQDYYAMKKQLKSLTNAARAYHLSMLQMNDARREVRVCVCVCVCIFFVYIFYHAFFTLDKVFAEASSIHSNATHLLVAFFIFKTGCPAVYFDLCQ
jgi:hypothetical protein